MAEETPNSTDINNTDSESGNDKNPNPNPKSSTNNVLAVNAIPSSPLVCLVNFAFDAASGAATGSVFGYGFGLWKNKGFKGSFADAAATAKTFAVMSGINSFVLCLLRRLRGKDDVINAGLSGCCTGLAISYPGPPVDLLKSCVLFASFGVMTEGLNKKQSALAQSNNSRESSNCPTAILPLAFPLSDELKGSFLSFCQSLSKSKKRNHPSAA